MNILYLNNIMEVGGVEKCILQLTKGFYKNNKIIICTAGGELEKEIKKIESVQHIRIINPDAKDPISIFKNIQKIYKIIKNNQIDIVHSHHRMTSLYCQIIKRIIDFKLIHTQHLCIEDKIRLTNIALRNIPIITVSNAAKEILVSKAKLNNSNITTIYNTIDSNRLNESVDSRLIHLKESGNFIIAQVSRAVEYKGIYDFIKIGKKISRMKLKIKLVFIGDGPDLSKMNEVIKKENLEDTIFLLGKKSNIIDHLNYIDLLLLCSYIEGLPLAPLEAFSQSIPVVATNIKGTNEEILDGYNGYLVQPKNIDKFVEKIIELYNNEKLLNQFKTNSYKTFEELFTVEHYIQSHQEIYDNLNAI